MDFSIVRTGKWLILAFALLSGALLPGCSCEDEVGYKKAVGEMKRMEAELSAIQVQVDSLAETVTRPEGIEPSWLYNQISRHEATILSDAARLQAMETYDIPQDRRIIRTRRKSIEKLIKEIRKKLAFLRGYRPR